MAPTPPSLDDSIDKLRWARRHFDSIRHDIEAFEQTSEHTFSVDVDPERGEYVVYVHHVPQAPEDWALAIGDVVHNARTALDYLMTSLLSLVTGQEPQTIDEIGFPIYDERSQFHGATRGNAKLHEQPAFSGYLARIEELQPYNVGNPSVWGTVPWGTGRHPMIHALPAALQRVQRLDIVDKHRALQRLWVGVRPQLRDISELAPDDFRSVGGSRSWAPLTEGAEVSRWRFVTPLPHEWQPSQEDMRALFPLQVSVGRGPDPFTGVLEVLALCIWGTHSVLELFAPVFSDHKPPLPVTAIRNIGAAPEAGG